MRRRGFLEASAAAAVGAWLGPAERLPGTMPFLGEGSFPLDKTIGAGLGRRRALDLATLAREALLVPQERFFIRTGCPDRLPPIATWTVRVHGLVETPVDVPLEKLKREAAAQGAQLLECAGNSRAAHFGLMSAATWSGVTVERLLGGVRLRPAATRVLVSGFDEHTVLDPGSVSGASWNFGLDELRASGAFLATEMNDEPLSPDHGHPLRLVVPGWYACTAIKWVNEIILMDDGAPPTDHMREYAGRTHQDSEVPKLARDFRPATIDPAAVPVRIDKLGRARYRIVGLAWGGASSLSIRLNPGLSWTAVAEIEANPSRPWSLWSHTVPELAPGRYRIEIAARGSGSSTRRLDAGFYEREILIQGD